MTPGAGMSELRAALERLWALTNHDVRSQYDGPDIDALLASPDTAPSEEGLRALATRLLFVRWGAVVYPAELAGADGIVTEPSRDEWRAALARPAPLDDPGYEKRVGQMADALHEDCKLEWQAIAVADPGRQVTQHLADAHYGKAHDLVRRIWPELDLASQSVSESATTPEIAKSGLDERDQEVDDAVREDAANTTTPLSEDQSGLRAEPLHLPELRTGTDRDAERLVPPHADPAPLTEEGDYIAEFYASQSVSESPTALCGPACDCECHTDPELDPDNCDGCTGTSERERAEHRGLRP